MVYLCSGLYYYLASVDTIDLRLVWDWSDRKEENSAGPKQDSLPQLTTTKPSIFKPLQTAKLTKLGLLSLSLNCFLTEDSLHQNRKANSYSPLPENDLQPLSWCLDLLIFRLPMCFQRVHAITSNTKYQNSRK